MAYSELIKSFGRIRAYLRSFYVFGFRHRDDFTQKSARSYDNERRRVESWLGEYMSFGQDRDGRRVFLSVDSRAIPANPLYRAFRAKSFTCLDITLHFHLLDMLSDGAPRPLTGIMDELTDRLSAFENGDLPDESTIRIKLKEYVSLGLIRSVRKGRETFYAISTENPDPEPWGEALAFFSEAMPLGVVGSYLRDRLKEQCSCFRFKHHYILNALDSEALHAVFSAIGKRQGISFTLGDRKETALPLKVYIGTQTGRQYLLGWVPDTEAFSFFRLDRMDRILETGPIALPASFSPSLRDFQRHVWGVSVGESAELEHVEMTVFIEDTEPFVLNRLEREKRCGEIVRLDECHWRFTADVFDALEMLPWLRTFIGRITALDSSNPEVVRRFWSDFEAMAGLYGVEKDAVS